MPSRRLIDPSLWSNEKFATLSPQGRLLEIGLISIADDQGRGKANPVYLRSMLMAYDDIPTAQVEEWLQAIQSNGTILLYVADGKRFYQLLNWWEYQSHQWAQPSDYPAPDGWVDRVRINFRRKMTLTCNWTKTDGTVLPDTCDTAGRPLPSVQVDDPARNPARNPDHTHKLEVQDKDQDQDKEEDQDQDQSPRGLGGDMPAEPDTSTTTKGGSRRVVQVDSPHLKGTQKLFVGGYVSPGAGTNAVLVYYERFAINLASERLSRPQEDDLVRACTDLPRLRDVVEAYSRTTFNRRNVGLILDWYRDGIPDHVRKSAPAAVKSQPAKTGPKVLQVPVGV
jgi:hypothetical protein